MLRLVLFVWLALVLTVVAEEAKLSPRHVSVTGTSITRAQPDIVVWSVTVRRTNRDLALAQAACDESVKKVLTLRNDLKLKLYAHFKQATVGDVTGERPGFMDFAGGAKFDAWSKLKGMSEEDAKKAYIKLVERVTRE